MYPNYKFLSFWISIFLILYLCVPSPSYFPPGTREGNMNCLLIPTILSTSLITIIIITLSHFSDNLSHILLPLSPMRDWFKTPEWKSFSFSLPLCLTLLWSLTYWMWLLSSFDHQSCNHIISKIPYDHFHHECDYCP